ncbi:NfeD family protein [Kiloniella sp. b19]|uniref:NfeD family protein n=1 Tax=Kiloniella sp. GXU_MW_B19 TaxID=3141326 RepID=UPI0031CFA3D6
MHEFFLNGNGWISLGAILVILEMLLGAGYILISFGLGALFVGLLVKSDTIAGFFQHDLAYHLLAVSVLAVVFLVVMRLAFKAKSSEDINQY